MRLLLPLVALATISQALPVILVPPAADHRGVRETRLPGFPPKMRQEQQVKFIKSKKPEDPAAHENKHARASDGARSSVMEWKRTVPLNDRKDADDAVHQSSDALQSHLSPQLLPRDDVTRPMRVWLSQLFGGGRLPTHQDRPMLARPWVKFNAHSLQHSAHNKGNSIFKRADIDILRDLLNVYRVFCDRRPPKEKLFKFHRDDKRSTDDGQQSEERTKMGKRCLLDSERPQPEPKPEGEEKSRDFLVDSIKGFGRGFLKTMGINVPSEKELKEAHEKEIKYACEKGVKEAKAKAEEAEKAEDKDKLEEKQEKKSNQNPKQDSDEKRKAKRDLSVISHNTSLHWTSHHTESPQPLQTRNTNIDGIENLLPTAHELLELFKTYRKDSINEPFRKGLRKVLLCYENSTIPWDSIKDTLEEERKLAVDQYIRESVEMYANVTRVCSVPTDMMPVWHSLHKAAEQVVETLPRIRDALLAYEIRSGLAREFKRNLTDRAKAVLAYLERYASDYSAAALSGGLDKYSKVEKVAQRAVPEVAEPEKRRFPLETRPDPKVGEGV